MAAVVDVRLAGKDDLPDIGEQLALAFDDDPLTVSLIPPGSRRREARLASFLRLGAKGALEYGEVWTTPDRAATAVWRAPGQWKVRGIDALKGSPGVTRALGRNVVKGLRMLQTLEAKHPSEPHWYLEILGTAPTSQGQGLGSAAMAPVLGRCDHDGLGAYLESSKEANVPYYQGHGFAVTEELPLPGGPSVWLMWRDPR